MRKPIPGADTFQWGLWLATVIGLLFAHATNNLLNDYTDSRRDIDKDNYYRNQCGVHVLEDGLMSECIQQRLLDEIAAATGQPVTLVAHSQGSVIAYEVLSILNGKQVALGAALARRHKKRAASLPPARRPGSLFLGFGTVLIVLVAQFLE